MKKDIQGLVDDIVEKHKNNGMIATCFGVPLSEFTKDELIAIFCELQENQFILQCPGE